MGNLDNMSILVHVSVYVNGCGHVYVYEYNCFMYVYMCKYYVCVYCVTIYNAVRIPLVSNCAI